jgi:hypothetical protein
MVCGSDNRGADLALEPRQGRRVAGLRRPDQPDRAGPLQQPVLGQVDHAHPAGADEPAELVLAELPGLEGLAAQRVDDVGAVQRQRDADGLYRPGMFGHCLERKPPVARTPPFAVRWRGRCQSSTASVPETSPNP